MNFNKIYKKLVKFADQLDRQGHPELADQIDQEILPEFQNEETIIEIPEDEKAMLDEVLQSLQDSLK